MGDMADDRIYADRLGKTDIFVATRLGVAVVSVSNDRIGQYSLRERCTARDIAAGGGKVLAATDKDVLLAVDPDGAFEPTGFGPAVAVGVADRPVAAAPDGTVAAFDGAWQTLGNAGAVRAIDGDLLAAADGVYRVDTGAGDGASPGLDLVGLDDARDVSTAGTPLAATGKGLYRLGPGWTTDLTGSFAVVAGDGRRNHAATATALYERPAPGTEWHERVSPADDPLVDVGYVRDDEEPTIGQRAPDGGLVAVTETGRFLVDPVASKDGAAGWRSRLLGLPGVAALAVPRQ